MFGKRKKDVAPGHLFQLAGMEVHKQLADELSEYAASTGIILVPIVEPSFGEDFFQMMKTEAVPRQAIRKVWAATVDALESPETEGMTSMEKRIAYRQSAIAAALIYSKLIQPGTDDACWLAVDECLAEVDDEITYGS